LEVKEKVLRSKRRLSDSKPIVSRDLNDSNSKGIKHIKGSLKSKSFLK